jgi:3-phenylpropionate/trans-cinnamate dioxygenase ferredoxin subunit
VGENLYNYLKLAPDQCDFVEVAAVGEVVNGERLFIEIGSTPIVLLNIGGTLFAIGDVCSHDDGPLGDGEIEGFEIICPRHGASFDIRTGKVISLPAVVDIPVYPIQLFEGKILIGLPK